MAQQPDTASARIYDFAVHRMQRMARQRRDAGTRRRFLWGYPAAGVLQSVEFSTPAEQLIPLGALAR